jgi:hypothetical protein
MARLFTFGLVISLSAFGCGDDGTMMTTDSGTPDTGSPPDSSAPDAPGGGTMRTAMIRVLDQNDAPVEGAMVALDTDRGRFEGTTDAAGEVTIDYRYDIDSTDAIVALEGYRIWASVDRAYMEPESADGYVEVVIAELDPDLGDTVRLIAGATGVPTGGRWCVSLFSFFEACQDEGATWDNRVEMGRFADIVQDYVYAYAYDDAGALYDFARADWTVMPDGNRSVTVDFDGTFDVTPVEQDFTLNLPADAESPFRTETLDETWHGWVLAVEPGTHLSRSALTMVALGTDSITMRIHTFPVMGDELIWAAAPYVNFADPARTFIWYSAMPSSPIDFLDLARVRSGDVWTDEFEWTAPATDVDRYLVQLINNGGVVVAQIATTNTYAQIPALPAGYDTSVSFPFPGAPGHAQILSVRGDLPPDEMATDPFRVDGEASTSLRYPIAF